MRARLGLVVAVSLLPATSGCWWQQTGFEGGRTYANPGETALTVGTIGDVVVRWGGASSSFPGEVVAGDTVYGYDAPDLEARDARTGALRWERPLPLDRVGPLLLQDGVLLTAGFDAEQECQPFPVPACGTVVANLGVHRFDAATGTPLPALTWSDTSYGPVGPLALAGPDDRYVLSLMGWFRPRFGPGPDNPSLLQVFDTVTGAPLPRLGIGLQGTELAPAVDDARGQVVVGSTSGIQAFEVDCAGCAPTWTVAGEPTALAVEGDTVVAATGTGELQLLDAATGRPTAGALVDYGPTSLAVGGGTIVARAPHRLWAFAGCTTVDCPHRWLSSVRAYGQPVIAGDLVYVNGTATTDEPGAGLDVYRLQGCGAPTCAPIARLPAHAGPHGPVVSGGVIVAGPTVLGLPG